VVRCVARARVVVLIHRVFTVEMSRTGAKQILRHSKRPSDTAEPRYHYEVGVEYPDCSQLRRELTVAGTGFKLPSVIIVMTYRREARFQKLIRQLRDLLPDAAEKQTHMIVAQSVDTTVESFTAAHASILSSFVSGQASGLGSGLGAVDVTAEPAWLGSVEHVKTPLLLNDTSFSNDLKQFGNKRNSMRNLIAGLARALERMGVEEGQQHDSVLVVEDDAVLSCDTMQFLAHANAMMSTDPTLAVASLELVTRPSVLTGNKDADWAFQSARKDPSGTVTLVANQRTVVKTYAWMLTRAYAAEYTALLRDADLDDMGGLSTIMAGCPFCEPYCYDHVSEWLLSASRRRVIYPGVPRVRQTKGMGMTYAENPVTPIFIGGVVPAAAFHEETSGIRIGTVSLFSIPGASAWRRPSYPSTSRIAYAVITTEPAIRYLGAITCLVLVTVMVIRVGVFQRCTKRKRYSHFE
jgi:hypothetical protein